MISVFLKNQILLKISHNITNIVIVSQTLIIFHTLHIGYLYILFVRAYSECKWDKSTLPEEHKRQVAAKRINVRGAPEPRLVEEISC